MPGVAVVQLAVRTSWVELGATVMVLVGVDIVKSWASVVCLEQRVAQMR